MILKNLLRRKVRTALTVLSISIGVAAVIALGALADGLEIGYNSMLQGSKADLILSQPDTFDISYSSIDEAVGAELAGFPEIDELSGMIQGFTLAEMIIVIAIIFVVSAVAIPNILQWREKARLGQAARDIYSEFQRAKIRAAQENSYCSILFDSAKFLVFVDANRNIIYDGGETVVKTKNWSDYGNVTLDGSQGGGDGLTFSNPSNGVAFSATGIPINSLGGLGMGTVHLRNSRGDTASIVLSGAGSVRIE